MLRHGWVAASSFILIPFLLHQGESGPSRIYTATSAGSFVSYNWGEQWHRVSNLPFSSVRAYACLGPQVFAGGDEGLLFSNDYGETWIEVEDWVGGAVVSILPSFYFAVEPTLFVGGRDGIFRSRDGGKQWRRVGEGMVRGVVHDLAWPGPTLLVATSTGLYRSEDSGDEWTKLEEGLPGAPLLSVVASRFFSQDPVAFVGTDGAGLYRTRDGQAFAPLNTPAGKNARVYSLFWWRGSLLAGTDSGLYISRGAGETWESPSPELTPRRILRILVPAPESPSGSDIIVGTERGVFKSSDGALSWRHLTDGMGEPEILGLGTFPIWVGDPLQHRDP